MDSKIIIANPAAIEEIKKRKGNNGEYQNGCILSGITRNNEPKEDWCRVDRITPAITMGMIKNLITFENFVNLNLSEKTGENSKKRTIVYNITHHAISNITDFGFHKKTGRIIL